ncbi:MAG: MBL fold metallo-hydrolase [Myxococcota bacterium]
MKVTVVGSADAFNGAGRGHSCYLLEGGRGPVMVDFGATALAGLRRLERQPGELDGILFTHLHGDHIGGVPYFTIDAMFHTGRTRPLSILGPVGTRDRLEALLRTTYGPVADYERSYALDIRELRPRERTEFLGLEITGYPADHMDPPDLPLCLRLSRENRTVAFSGDTAMTDGLLEAIDGVDLAFVECTGLAHPIGRHCAWTDWVEVGPGLTAQQVVFTHLGQDVRAAAERGHLRLNGGPPFSFADDGQVHLVAG